MACWHGSRSLADGELEAWNDPDHAVLGCPPTSRQRPSTPSNEPWTPEAQGHALSGGHLPRWEATGPLRVDRAAVSFLVSFAAVRACPERVMEKQSRPTSCRRSTTDTERQTSKACDAQGSTGRPRRAAALPDGCAIPTRGRAGPDAGPCDQICDQDAVGRADPGRQGETVPRLRCKYRRRRAHS